MPGAIASFPANCAKAPDAITAVVNTPQSFMASVYVGISSEE